MKTKQISCPALSVISLCTVLITACSGETKQAQCQKIGDVVNSLSAISQSVAEKPNGLSQLSVLGNQTANDLDALKLSDKKLSDLRSQLAVSMRQQSEATLQLAQIAGSSGSFDDSPEAQAVLAQNTAASKDFQAKFNATQSYCSGGTASAEVASTPTT